MRPPSTIKKPTTPTKPKPSVDTARAKRIKSRIGLARLYRNTGKKELALKTLKKLIETYPIAPEIKEAKALLEVWK